MRSMRLNMEAGRPMDYLVIQLNVTFTKSDLGWFTEPTKSHSMLLLHVHVTQIFLCVAHDTLSSCSCCMCLLALTKEAIPSDEAGITDHYEFPPVIHHPDSIIPLLGLFEENKRYK